MEQLTLAQLSTLSSSLPSSLSLSHLSTYIRVCRFLKPEILITAKNPQPTHLVPEILPSHVAKFLGACTNLSDESVLDVWSKLKEVIWDSPTGKLDEGDRGLFEKHGKGDESGEKHLVCPVRYYPQYYIDYTTKTRHYYASTFPDFIHLEQHTYIQRTVCELFTIWMVFAWVSAQNSANIYNHALSGLADDWRVGSESRFILTSEQVWRAFVLHTLFRRASEYNTALTMSEAPGVDQDLQLKEAQIDCNDLVARNRLRERLHACTTCEKFIPTDLPDAHLGLRPLRAVVVDGVTIGRPCCKVHNCPHPPINNRSHYCAFHHEKRKNICVVTGCILEARPAHRTCSIAEHIALKDYRNLKGKSFFMLKRRLENTHSQLPDGEVEDEGEIELNTDPAHKSDLGNTQVKARFGRRRTHNEQLVVCTCGIIAARATLFGAEAISGVKDLLKSIYPDRRELPEVIFFDNNCKLQAHLLAANDTYFKTVIMPVDVFHFKCKHSQFDEFCTKHCNPAKWPELVNEDGQWVFNSSAAEQANVWIGGYQAIVWEMLPHNYDFFLDEMINRRNEIMIERLTRTQKYPYHVPTSHELDTGCIV
ncbi:hypothetical protein PQX77_019466 [Marasmius sp. AFHP31]|nr:hypothetical protein PQX77_019466 [Marasmius sp. AFHP31]